MLSLNTKTLVSDQIKTAESLQKSQFGFDTLDQSINTIGAGVQIFSSLASLYTGFQQLDLAEQARKDEREKFELAKQNLERVNKVVGNLTANFG